MRQLLAITLFISLLLALNVTSMATEMSNEDCLTCHSGKDLEAVTERGKALNLYVPENPLVGSVHEGMSCTDCHKGEKSFDDAPHAEGPLIKACPDCHDEAQQAMSNDVHGVALESGNPRAPSCGICHGGHQILPLSSPDSRFSKKKQPDTCGKCHGGDKLQVEEKGITKRNLVSRYKSSVHYEAILQDKNAAACTDCHGYHGILSSASDKSGVSRTGIPNSCQKCHPIQAKTFWTGAHGSALLHGNNDVPNCTTCHGDHDMASLRTRVGDAKQWASTQVCIWCHGNARMMARYGLNTTPVDSYMRDFHGLTQRGTMGASATCSDCHDPHHSLPSSHPSSRMYISNRGPTCGKCHGKVSESFAKSFTHRKAIQGEGFTIENVVRIIYIILIAMTIGGMAFYTFLIWLKSVRDKFKTQRKLKHITRMTRYERTSHMILFISFSMLVITGFALKFPETFWAKWLFSLGVNETIRAFLHRLAAMTMCVDFFLFMFYMFVAKRGKCVLKEILPRKHDITEIFASFKYYLGLSKEEHAPKRRVFNFTEKVEFWALVWGTLIMLLTGLILWFPKAVPDSWPVWVMNVARIIHFFEAILATLAILIWHGFFTIFHPAEYPMNTAWLTGYITEEEAKEHFTEEAVEKMTRV